MRGSGRTTNKVKPWEVERFSRGCKRGCLLLKRGRSAAFADPDKTAIEAGHVWLPEARAPERGPARQQNFAPVPGRRRRPRSRIYSKLQTGPRGLRIRQANLSIDIARRAWDVVRRLVPAAVPPDNPWRGVERDTTKITKPAATRSEAYALAEALRQIGEPHLGAAALICFEWHQRPEHVRKGDITWADYRPSQRSDAVQIRHPKTGEKGWMPLTDKEGALFPELEAYLAALPRLGLPIVLTSGRRGPARPYSDEYAQRKVREARKFAGLGAHVTLDACRHGGMTELGDAGATEFEGMAASMHKTPQALRLYVKRSEAQRIAAARKRRRLVDGQKG
jgi:hypothetical protein